MNVYMVNFSRHNEHYLLIITSPTVKYKPLGWGGMAYCRKYFSRLSFRGGGYFLFWEVGGLCWEFYGVSSRYLIFAIMSHPMRNIGEVAMGRKDLWGIKKFPSK